MNFINLSTALRGAPEIEHEVFVFNGGEPHIKITGRVDPNVPVCISVQACTAIDTLTALLASDALRRMNVREVNLFIPYFPAARQDRLMVQGEPLSVKVFANMINAAGFNRVWVFDPHSEVAPALLDRCTVVNNHQFVAWALHQCHTPQNTALVAPDAGAAKKIHHLSAALQWPNLVQCDKTRNIATGKLSAPKVFADDLKGMDCMIVDDICDGGGTFIQLAEALKAHNAGKLYLAVSHGIFSNGLEPLKKHFTKVFTTNSFYKEAGNDFIHVHALNIA